MPKVSVLIPVYNVSQYLKKCLDTVCNQTLKDIEIICVNDGSTDNSLEILQKYKQQDSRIILINQENSGYGKAMNNAFEATSGEYIGIVEPDDYIDITMFQTLYQIAKEHELDFIKSDFYRFKTNKNGDIKFNYYHLSDNIEDYNKVFNPSQNLETLKYKMNTWSGIYKRDFLVKNNIKYNESPGASFQDNGFYFQTFIFATKAMIINQAFYMNRRDNPNSSVKDKQKVYAMNTEYDYIKSILQKDQNLWNYTKNYYWLKRLQNCLTTIDRIAPEHKLKYIENLQKEINEGLSANEINQSIFPAEHWQKIMQIKKSPKKYFKQLNKKSILKRFFK